jgi:hypothetical protein
MTVTIDSDHILEHNKFMKKIDTTIQQQKEADVDESVEHVNELIDALQKTSEEQKADFSRDASMRRKIDHLFEKNPRAFGYEKNYCWGTAEERSEMIVALQEEFNVASKNQSKKEPMPLEELFMSPAASVKEEQEDVHLDPEVMEALDKLDPELIEELSQNGPAILEKGSPEEKKKWVFKDVNLGYAFINMQMKAFDITEGRIHKLVRQLSHLNEQNKDLSALINGLTRFKESGKADFSNDPEMRAFIDRIYEMNPKIFGNQKAYAWNTEKQIDVLLSSLDSEVKAKVAEINQVTMFVNVRFDERIQYSENPRKVLDMLIRHCESIISKYHKT